MKYWLMKTEPDVFSISDLQSCPNQTEHWDGIRNYQARNYMRDDMKVGDQVFIYHSRCEVPGIVGVAEVVKEAYPDHTCWDKKSKYFDEKSSKENPRWVMVDVKFKDKFENIFSLTEIKEDKILSEMLVAKRGQRLSIMPVEKKHFNLLIKKNK